MTTKIYLAGRNGMPAMHPGKFLKAIYLDPMGISANKLAQRMHVTPARVNEIVRGERGITADTALRLGKVFETTPQLWLNLQNTYEVRLIETSDDVTIDNLEPFEMMELV